MTEDLQLSVGIGGEKAFMAAIGQMTNAVGQLTGKIDTLGKESSETTAQTSKMSFGFKDALSFAGVSMGLEAAVQGVIGLGKAAIGSSIEYEQLSISLGVLLGDASKVPGVLDEWKKFSDATPFEPEQVNKAGKALLAFGFETEQLVPLMTKIGDVASGTGKDFNELATIYGKARVAGTLMSEDINQLTEAGIPIMEELAAVLGTSTDKVKKMASEGKITFPLFEQAFGRLTGEGGKFGGMMDKLSQSTGGILSTLKGEFDGFLRTIGDAFLPIIRDLALGAMPLLKAALVVITPVLKAISAIFAGIKSFITPLIPPLEAIWNAFQKIGQAIAPLVEKLMPSLSSDFSIIETAAGALALVLEGIGIVINAMADAVIWAIDTWDRFIANSPGIAKAIEYITLPLRLLISPLQTVGKLWDDIFGDGGDSVGGLAQKSQSYISELAKVAGKEFGATSQQVIAFSKTLKASEFAGKSQGDALILLKEKFAAFMEAEKAAAEAGKTMNSTINGTKKEAEPAAGSIDYLTKQIKKLKDEFNATADASQRMRLGGDIDELETQLEILKKQGDEMGGLTSRSVSLTTGQTGASDAMKQMATDGLNAMASLQTGFTTTTTAWQRFTSSIGEEASGKLKEGIDQLKSSFRSFGVQAVESMAYAIGAGQNAGDAFRKVIASMMVEVPKLAGMALLNAAVAAGPTPAGLAMAVAGLALIGLSGLVGGIQSKNAAEQSAMNTELNNLPQGATGAPGATSMGGLGGFIAGQQQQPIMVNLNAEMDGVQLGGLFRRITTNYNKTAIRNQ